LFYRTPIVYSVKKYLFFRWGVIILLLRYNNFVLSSWLLGSKSVLWNSTKGSDHIINWVIKYIIILYFENKQLRYSNYRKKWTKIKYGAIHLCVFSRVFQFKLAWVHIVLSTNTNRTGQSFGGGVDNTWYIGIFLNKVKITNSTWLISWIK